jgi:hypothetical protein
MRSHFKEYIPKLPIFNRIFEMRGWGDKPDLSQKSPIFSEKMEISAYSKGIFRMRAGRTRCFPDGS